MLLAALLDGQKALFWQQAAMHRGKGDPAPPYPQPVRRPGVRLQSTSTPISTKAREFLDARRRAHLERTARV